MGLPTQQANLLACCHFLHAYVVVCVCQWLETEKRERPMPSLIPDFATLETKLAGLPVVTHRAREVVLIAGSKTGELLFLRSGTVEVVKDGVQIASVKHPARCSANRPSSWTNPIRQT